MKAVYIFVKKFWPAIIVLSILISLFSCEDKYKDDLNLLTSENFYLHYPDTTTIVKYAVTTNIVVVKPDSVKFPTNYKYSTAIIGKPTAFYYPYKFQLDTITGNTNGGTVPVVFTNLSPATVTIVDIKTGQINFNNIKRVFIAGEYQFYVSLVTPNGITRFRDKPIKIDIIP